MKKRNETEKKGNPMKGDMSFAYDPHSPPLRRGSKLGGDLILPPEMWKKLNEIAANPEKYMYDPDEYSGEAGELDVS
jgi:hypothetical protein